MLAEEQGVVIDFLSRPESYGETGPVERVETHISHLFMVGDRAFKLKKAVKFSYLDFSTLDLRRRYCEAELELNRRTAPDIYRRVVPVIDEGGGTLALNGEGKPVEWLVEMTRFDQGGILERVAARGEMDRALLENLAARIVDFHTGAEVRKDRGGAAGLGGIVENNARCFADWGADIFDPALIARVTEGSRRALAACAAVLDQRQAAGLVRHCHGDMHLGNIVVLDGRPTLFDCIEFSDAIACIDVLYDLAFLLMDLDHRHRRREAALVFNRYMDLTGDVGGLAALPLMLSVRAGVRAHVGAAAAAQLEEGARRDEAVATAQGYLEHAAQYLEPSPPRLIAVGGLSGSGKSRLARTLSPLVGGAPGALVSRSDAIRKRLAGVGLTDRLGAEYYTKESSLRVYATMFDEARTALAAGHSAIVDAVFADPAERAQAARLAGELGVPFSGLWVEAPVSVMEERVTRRKGNASDAGVDVLRKQLTYDLGAIDWSRIDSAGPKKDTLDAARALLGV
ncbi:MAG: AAA family ATPase [Rhodospirillales bacterium]|nr:AAA family ATPase [Rhodospirillales bacterium]